jgi:hypothetical protein
MTTSPTVETKVLLGLPPVHLQLEAEAKAGIYSLNCNNQWKPTSEGSGHVYMTRNIEREPILQMGTDKMIPGYGYDKSLSGFLVHKGTGAGVRLWHKQDTQLQCWAVHHSIRTDRRGGLLWYRHWSWGEAMAQAGHSVAVLGSTPQFSRQKCMTSKHAWLRIWIGAIGIDRSTFSEIAKLQLKL